MPCRRVGVLQDQRRLGELVTATRAATIGHDRCGLAWHAVRCFRWREAGPVSVPAVHEYGPYTLYDLDALPEDGKR